MNDKTELDIDAERPSFEAAMNAARFFPAELDFTRTKSPSGRDEYVNSHLESCWFGWLAARRATIQPMPAEHRAVIEEAAQVLESAAAHNRAKGRTVLERTQQGRAERLRLALAAQCTQAVAPADAVRDARNEALEEVLREIDGLDVLATSRGGTVHKGHLVRMLKSLKTTQKEPPK